MHTNKSPKPVAPMSDGLIAFSAELATRHPNIVIKAFTMPRKIAECREVFIREMTGQDEIEAAIMADSILSTIEKQSMKLTLEAERRESMRAAIVGLGELKGGKIVYRHANSEGVPLDLSYQGRPWTQAAMTALSRFYAEVNGVPTEELEEGIKEARTVGAYAPPTSATHASADTGK